MKPMAASGRSHPHGAALAVGCRPNSDGGGENSTVPFVAVVAVA
ncbi:MAG: hypothetical protein AAF088_20860 [Pseudomonadota bacterium]